MRFATLPVAARGADTLWPWAAESSLLHTGGLGAPSATAGSRIAAKMAKVGILAFAALSAVLLTSAPKAHCCLAKQLW